MVGPAPRPGRMPLSTEGTRHDLGVTSGPSSRTTRPVVLLALAPILFLRVPALAGDRFADCSLGVVLSARRASQSLFGIAWEAHDTCLNCG